MSRLQALLITCDPDSFKSLEWWGKCPGNHSLLCCIGSWGAPFYAYQQSTGWYIGCNWWRSIDWLSPDALCVYEAFKDKWVRIEFLNSSDTEFYDFQCETSAGPRKQNKELLYLIPASLKKNETTVIPNASIIQLQPRSWNAFLIDMRPENWLRSDSKHKMCRRHSCNGHFIHTCVHQKLCRNWMELREYAHARIQH